MIYSIFKNNQNYLLYLESVSLVVSHSFIDHLSSSLSSRTSVSTTTNNTFFNSITYQIQFFNSHHCNADIPLIEHVIMTTIDQTFEKTFSFKYPTIILMIYYVHSIHLIIHTGR